MAKRWSMAVRASTSIEAGCIRNVVAFSSSAGDSAGARKEYELALEVAPDAAVARLLLANHYHGGRDHRAALTTLEPLLEREPFWAEPYLLRGLAFDSLGEGQAAAEQYTEFLERAEDRADRRAPVRERLAALGRP